jgi:sulfonate transport system substrate-binding protein
MRRMTSDHDRPTRPPSPGTGPRTRRWPALLLALAVSGVLAACGSSSSNNHSATATGANAAATKSASGAGSGTLRVGDQAGTGAQALLSAAGLLSKLPFKVSWADFTSGPPMLQAMSAGALDIGGVGDAPPVFAAAGGAKISVVGALATNVKAGALLVPKGSTINSISQLRGKKIAVAQGSSADYHLLTVLAKAGLTVHDVTLEYLQPAQALAALTSGSVDAWDVWAPFIQQAVAQDGARILVNGQGYGSNYSYEVASKSAISSSAKASEIRTYLKLLNQAHVWADTHPAAWAKTWSAATGLPTSVMVTAAGDDTAKPVPVNSSTVTAEQSLVDAFSKAGLIPSRYDFSNYVYDGFNSAVGAQ